LVETKGAVKWWDIDPEILDARKVNWDTLVHNGPIFPPPYEPHYIPLKYDGELVKLTPRSEEVASFYAVMLESDLLKKKAFNVNFFNDWRGVMTDEEKAKITELGKCDFTLIKAHREKVRDERKLKRKEPAEKKKIKAEKERMDSLYAWALIDGTLEKVGNYRVEPPGLFRGRGDHPKTGMLKQRVMPEDIVLNLGVGVPIPKCPMEGHNWKGVMHEQKVTWLAFWNDNINKDFKYVYLSANSRFKGQADRAKYEKARKLKKYIGKIREDYEREMHSRHPAVKQRATAMYTLDKLALRVGNEKDLDQRADTVGLCSLRVEHIKFPEENTIYLEFLGKDSMLYKNTVKVPPQVYKNLEEFATMTGKTPKSDLFDLLNTGSLNDHLKTIMPGLSGKVFRTYNASITLQAELREKDASKLVKPTDPVSQKVLAYNRANREVAILCNHQRSVPKAFGSQMEKLQERIKTFKKNKSDLKKQIANLKKDDEDQIEIESDFKLPKDIAACKKKIERLDVQIENYLTKVQLKDDTKTVALGTSKINYMDPRVTVAWCKATETPIEKVFNKSLLSKFPWAMEGHESWRF